MVGPPVGLLLVLRFVRAAMSGAAMWAIVVTRCRPHILPFFVAPVALVKIAEEAVFFHGSSRFLNARNFGTFRSGSSSPYRAGGTGAVIGTADCGTLGALTPRFLWAR